MRLMRHVLTTVLWGVLLACSAAAQERGHRFEHRHHEEARRGGQRIGMERGRHDNQFSGERFHRRFHNGHLRHPRYNYHHHGYHRYPYVYTAPTVFYSSGPAPVTYNGGAYYYDGGTFYQSMANGGGYVNVPPPLGAVVAALPAGAEQVNVRGEIFFRYNGVYYRPLAEGYKVVEPPRKW